jgi:hypothetical protein
MGKHYVPQAHLRRFQDDSIPGLIWMYDKKTKSFVQASISNVAQQADFYSEDVEKALANVIELPGNRCMNKLLRQESLDNAERTQLSLYMMVMATRGPRQRRKSFELASKVLATVIDDTQKEFEQLKRENLKNSEQSRMWQEELDAVAEKYSKQMPEQILNQINTPFWSEKTVECIHNMAWHIIPAPPSMCFVTCDTPAHFFEGLGLGNSDSEFTFTISKTNALIGEQRHSWGITYEKSNVRVAKEVNRRILSAAERFVFSPRKGDWIEIVAQKTAPHLNLIRW